MLLGQRPARDGAPCSPAASGSEERAGGEKGATHIAACCKRGEMSLKGCPEAVGRGAGVAGGAHRAALTAPGGRRGPYPQTRPLISLNSRGGGKVGGGGRGSESPTPNATDGIPGLEPTLFCTALPKCLDDILFVWEQ